MKRYRCDECVAAIKESNGRRTEARSAKPNEVQERWAWGKDRVPAAVTDGAPVRRLYVPEEHPRMKEWRETFRAIPSLCSDD